MRNYAIFHYLPEFGADSDEDGILTVEGAKWFLKLLRRIPEIHVDENLCQEDWGVVFFANRDCGRFWIGLSLWPDGECAWLVHLHHHAFAWLQKLSRAGREKLNRLIIDLSRVLSTDSMVTDIQWHRDSDMKKGKPQGTASPNEP